MASSSSSSLTIKLHPLVILNISDHYTRLKSLSLPASPPPRVYGCVIGVQCGRTVEICNSFQLIYDSSTNSLLRYLLEEQQDLYEKAFPNFHLLGWYSTGSDVLESDMIIHKSLMQIIESPVYMLLNPEIDAAQKDLPITIYESEMHVIDGNPQHVFVRSTYTIETVDAEKVSVDHVTRLNSSGDSAATLSAQLTGICSAIKMLNGRLKVLLDYLLAMQNGETPCEYSFLRQASSILGGLPAAIKSEKFLDDLLMEYNDTLLMTHLAMLTDCTSTMNELADKIHTAYGGSKRASPTSIL